MNSRIVLGPSLEATAESMLRLDCCITIITGTITQAESSRQSHCLLSRAKCWEHTKGITQKRLGGEQMSISTRVIDDCVCMQQRIAEKGRDGRNSFEDGKIKGMLEWAHYRELFYVLLDNWRSVEVQNLPASWFLLFFTGRGLSWLQNLDSNNGGGEHKNYIQNHTVGKKCIGFFILKNHTTTGRNIWKIFVVG